MTDIQLVLQNLEEAREDLKKSLKRRREIVIAENDTHFKEIDTTKVFANGDTKEFDVAIENLMEKNRVQVEEIRSLKIEKESQAMMLCEITKMNKSVIEDKAMIEDDKRNLAKRLEEIPKSLMQP